MKRILAGIPCYHAVEPEPFINFMILSQATGRAEAEGKYAVRWMCPGPKIKAITARNMISQMAIAGGADLVLMFDDDMVVTRDLIERLLMRDVDVVSPIFFRSHPPIDPLVYTFDEFGDRVPYYDYPRQAIFETPGGNGTGVMLIKVEVLKAMPTPIWVGRDDTGVAEDVHFCDRARALGFKTWCDSTVEAKQMSLSMAIGSEHYDAGRLTR